MGRRPGWLEYVADSGLRAAMRADGVTPVCLFAYARPDHLRRTLAALRANQVPLLYAFSDGPRLAEHAAAVAEVRTVLRAVDWCEVRLHERDENFGLGRSILSGVTEVLKHHDTLLVFEDDLVCVPGTYDYLTGALRQYADDRRVMSVTGWTHPRVIPKNVTNQPYFDGRAECLVWGTWARAWQGMDQPALALAAECRRRGIDIYRYGADLIEMARVEHKRNIWAVRFIYHHLLNAGLCLRPPYSLVEHIGFDGLATNSASADGWEQAPPQPCPSIPETWPEAIESAECPRLWRQVYGSKPNVLRQGVRRLRELMRSYLKQ